MKLPLLPLSLISLLHGALSSSSASPASSIAAPARAPLPRAPASPSSADAPISTGIVLRANIAIHTSPTTTCDPSTSGPTLLFLSVPPSTCLFSSTELSHNSAISVTGTIFGYAGANNYVSGFRWPNCWQEILRYSYPRNKWCLEVPERYRAVSYNWTFKGYEDYNQHKLMHINGETMKKWPDSFGRWTSGQSTHGKQDGLKPRYLYGRAEWAEDEGESPSVDQPQPQVEWESDSGEGGGLDETDGLGITPRDRIPFDDFDDQPVVGWKPAPGCIGPDFIEYYDLDAGRSRRIPVKGMMPVPLTNFVKRVVGLYEKKGWKELGKLAGDEKEKGSKT